MLVISSVLLTVVTAGLVLITFLQYQTSKNQLGVMRNMIDQNERLIKASGDQANASARSASVAESEIQAVNTQANASLSQANTSAKLVEQNEKAVNAAISQSKSAQESAMTARQSYALLERPMLGIDTVEAPVLEVGNRARVRLTIKNFGHIPARNTTIEAASVFASPVSDLSAPCPEPAKVAEWIGVASRSLIPVNDSRLATAISHRNVSAEDIALVTERKTYWIYLYVRIKYGDTEQYFFEFYARHNIEKQGWDECGSHNRAN